MTNETPAPSAITGASLRLESSTFTRRSCHAPKLGRVGLVSDAQKALALIRRAMISRSAVRSVRRTLETLPPHPPQHYRVAVYFADGAVNMYQMRQWYKPLAELAQRWPVVVL